LSGFGCGGGSGDSDGGNRIECRRGCQDLHPGQHQSVTKLDQRRFNNLTQCSKPKILTYIFARILLPSQPVTVTAAGLAEAVAVEAPASEG
jgi:hypothetical protein